MLQSIQMHSQAANAPSKKTLTEIGHTCEHTQTALCGRRPRDGDPPLPVLTIQPLNLAFMNGNTFRSLDGNLFQSKFDKGHSHVDSQASSQVFTGHVVIAFATPNILNINSRELVLGKRGEKKKIRLDFFFFGFSINNSPGPVRSTKCGRWLGSFTLFFTPAWTLVGAHRLSCVCSRGLSDGCVGCESFTPEFVKKPWGTDERTQRRHNLWIFC